MTSLLDIKDQGPKIEKNEIYFQLWWKKMDQLIKL